MTKKELLACLTFVQEFSHYLKGKSFLPGQYCKEHSIKIIFDIAHRPWHSMSENPVFTSTKKVFEKKGSFSIIKGNSSPSTWDFELR